MLDIEKKTGAFVRQAAILIVASLLVRLLGFMYRLPLTHFIGDEGNAFYVSAYTIYTFGLVISFGAALTAAISRLTSERLALGQYRNAFELFKSAMLFSAVSGIIVALFLFFGADGIVRGFGLSWLQPVLSFPDETAVSIRAIAPGIFLVAILVSFRGFFMGMKTAVPTAVSQVVEQIFKVAFSVFLAYLFLDAADLRYAAAGAAAGTVIGVFAALVVVVVFFIKKAQPMVKKAREDTASISFETRFYQIKRLFFTALPIVVGLGLVSFANILDLSMSRNRLLASGAFTSSEIYALIGQFSAKFILLTTLPVSLSIALSSAVIPEITSSSVEMDTGAIKKKTNMALRLSMALSIPAAVGLTVLADPIIILLFPSHPEGGLLLRYGASSIIFLAMVQVISGVLHGLGHMWLPAICTFFGLLVKIPLNYFLLVIPSVNILGAVISTIACFAVAACALLVFLYKKTGILPDLRSAFLKPFIASVVMGVVCFFSYTAARMIFQNSASVIFAVILGFLSYMLMLSLTGGLHAGDFEALPIPHKIRRLLNI